MDCVRCMIEWCESIKSALPLGSARARVDERFSAVSARGACGERSIGDGQLICARHLVGPVVA
eukprot:1268312-Lingulodinium_polyedra.AAC.1